MLNVVAIMGRLAADPQLRQTTTGKTSLRSASHATADAATPTARVRLTGWMLLPGIARQSLSASISRRVL